MKEWIIKDQLGRRNLTEQEASYYRGKLYSARKQQGARTDLTSGNNYQKLSRAEELGKQCGGDRKSSCQNVNLIGTAEELGSQYGVDEKTIS